MRAADPLAVDFVYQEARAQIDSQDRRVDALDAKAIAILTAASLVVTVAPAARLAGRQLSLEGLGLMIAAGLSYVVLMVLAQRAMWPRDFHVPADPPILAEDYLDATPGTIRRAILDVTIQHYGENKSQLAQKVRALKWSLSLLLAESVFLTLAIVVS